MRIAYTLDSRMIARYSSGSSIVGGLVWVGSFARSYGNGGFVASVTLLLLFAFFVITPLSVRLLLLPVGQPPRSQLAFLAIVAQPIAAGCAGAALLPLPLAWRIGGALLWLLFTILLALNGLLLAWQGQWQGAALCRAAALVYLPIGALWYLAFQAHIRPLGLGTDLVLLTAVHFHYIPLVALSITGLVGGELSTRKATLSWHVYRLVAGGMLSVPLLVATGITLTQLTGNDGVETVAALLQALTVIGLAFLVLRYIAPTATSPLARGGFICSGAAVLVSMTAASLFALGNATGAWAITYAQMLLFHGWVNALLFGACGLGGWLAHKWRQMPSVAEGQ